MEILLLVVIGLIAKNFKSILKFITEQSQVNGVPPFQKDSGSHRNLSNKPSAEFSYEKDSFENKSKVFKLKNSSKELAEDLPFDKNNPSVSITNKTDSYHENTSNDQNRNYNQNSDFDESIIKLDELKKGVIWQEILEPPRARRPHKIF
jgi:hypothetical protein